MEFKRSSKKVVAFVCALSLMATQVLAVPSGVTSKLVNNVSVSASTIDLTTNQKVKVIAGAPNTTTSVAHNGYPWSTNDSAYDGYPGFYSSYTGDLYKNTTQTETITFNVDGDFRLYFQWAVSSEVNFDKLNVYLDDTVIVENKSGTDSGTYSNDNIEVGDGVHTLSFSYSKDGSNNHNDDRAYVYNIQVKPPVEQPPYVNGVYEISNEKQLLWFAEYVNAGNVSVSAKLMDDIDYGDIQTQIGSGTYYTGTFDGNGHTIKVNFNYNSTYAGLFRYINGATIKNLTVDGNILTTGTQAGGIVGRSGNGSSAVISTIENCVSNVTLTSTYNSSNNIQGGIVGSSYGTNINNCAFTGSITNSVSSTAECSGIMGYSNNTYLTNTISNCYVTANMANGGNLYTISKEASSINNCYYLDTIGTPYVQQGTSMNIDQFYSGEVAYKLSHNEDGTLNGSNWGQAIDYENTEVQSYPVINGLEVFTKDIYDPCSSETTTGVFGYSNYEGQQQFIHHYDANGFDTTTEDDTITFNHDVSEIELYEPATLNNGYYEIGNIGQLYWFAKQINEEQISSSSNAILTSDIIISDEIKNSYVLLPNWTPIASTANMKYTGTFNGNGHIISGLTYIDTDAENPNEFDSGFISEIGNSGKVINLGIENSTFEDTVGGNNVGSIAGNNGGTIANCYSTATVIGGEENMAGGITGIASSSGTVITNVYFGGTVDSNNPIMASGSYTKIKDNVYYLSTSFDGNTVSTINKNAKMVYATTSDVPEGVTDAIVVSSGQLTYLLERKSSGELLNFDSLGYVPLVQDLPDTLEAITNGTVIDVVPRFAKNTDDATTNLVYKSYLTDTCNQFVTPSECTTIYTNTNGGVIFGIHGHDSGSIKSCEKPTAWTDGMIVNQSNSGNYVLTGEGDKKISQTDFNALKPNTVADCVTKAVQWYQCDDCGAYFYVVGSIAANNHNADYSRDGKIDWNDILYIAENDKDNFDKIVNISTSYYPTCTSSGTAYITKCANDNNHSVSVPISYTMEDYYDLRCILDGESFKTTYPTVSNFLDDKEIRAILHRESNSWDKVYYPNGTVLHVLKCNNCGEILSSHVEDIEYSYTTKKHTVVSSSCTNDCDIHDCHKVGDTAYHNFYRYSPITKADGTIDATKHYATCYDCGAVVAQPHEFDENGVCVDCGYDITTNQEKANASVKINLVPDYNYYGDLETVDDIKKVRFTLSVDDTDKDDNYYITRVGVVYTKNLDGTTVDSEDLIIENINGTTVKGAYSKNNGFYMNLTPVAEDDTVAVRAYAVVYDLDTGNAFTVYSDVETDTLENTRNSVQEIIDQRNLEKALKDKASVSVEKQEIEGYELYQKAKFVVTRTINNPEDTTYSCVRYGFVYSKNFDYDITQEEAESQLVVENIDGTNIKGAYSSSTSNPASIYANITNNGTHGLTLFRPYYVIVDGEGNEHIFYGDIVANVGYGIK